MRLEALTLDHFRCYGHTEVSFEPGVTVVHGVNGSGKSTLLDACFFALYGADALPGTLDEAVSIGAEEASVTLSITHDGKPYELVREIRIRGERAHTATCELETPDGVISGARDVEAEVARLLRMEADAFLNCAYVRQGEVNKLIHASPRERQDMIDELLQLGVLETYRDRATAARRGIASLRDEHAGQLEAIEEQIAAKEAAELTAQLNDLETKRNAIDTKLEELDEQVEEAEETRDAAKEVLERLEERQSELEELTEEIEEVEARIAETVAEQDECREQVGEHTEALATVRERIESTRAELDASIADREAAETRRTELRERDEELREEIEEIRLSLHEHTQRADQADERREEAKVRAAELEEDLEAQREAIEEAEETIASRREALGELEEQRDSLQASIEAAGVDDPDAVGEQVAEAEDLAGDLRERERELETRIETTREDIEEMEALLEEGKCPTCGQSMHGAPATEELEAQRSQLKALQSEREDVAERREAAVEEAERLASLAEDVDELERLEERIQSASELVDEQERRLADRRETIERLEDDLEAAKEEAADAAEREDEAREAADEQRKRIADVNATRQELADTIETVEDLLSAFERREELEGEIERLRERIDSLEDLNDERRERLAEKREQRRALAEQVDEDRIASARTDLNRAEKYLEQAAGNREELQEERDTVIDRIGAVQNELDELRGLEERREELEARQAAIAQAHEDAATLESLYADLRAELREQNLIALERMLNETFDLVYQNDAYDRIELDRDYRFTVYQKDGSEMDPSLLSGGERALFNLSLRCAIYRLLSEGIQGTAPLPPLILDEPTVYLDAGHVGQLVELVDAMRALGVEQIVIVTHDEELLRVADVVLGVEKDPTTNRSRVVESTVMPGIPTQD